MTLIDLDRATNGGVGATSGTTPLVAVRLLTGTSVTEHLVLDAEALEGLTGTNVLDVCEVLVVVHTVSVAYPSDSFGCFGVLV